MTKANKDTRTKILLLTLGGTIDSEPYSEVPGEYPPDATPRFDMPAQRALLNMLWDKQDRNLALDATPICYKDSKDVVEEDIQKVIDTVKAQNDAGYQRIIITCGTDKMCQIAQRIKKEIPGLKAPVVFTGSIWPLVNGPHSDAWNNLELAVFGKPELKPGTYIAMSGLLEDADLLEKDFENKCFKKKSGIVTAVKDFFGPEL